MIMRGQMLEVKIYEDEAVRRELQHHVDDRSESVSYQRRRNNHPQAKASNADLTFYLP